MSPRAKRFIDEYLIDLNMTQAAIRAGYSKKTAYSMGQRLLKNVEVSQDISERQAKKRKANQATEDDVIDFLTNVLKGKETEQTLRLVGKGTQEVDTIEVQAKDKLKAAELLGKHFGMFTDKQQIDVQSVSFVDDVPEEDDG